MTGHRTYLYVGAGTVRTANHASAPKSHRAFSHPVRPPVSKEPADAVAA